MALSRPAMNLILNTGLVLVIWVGAYRVNSGAAEAGDLIAFQTYFTIILGAVMGMNRIITEFTKALASADRIQAVLDAPEDLLVKPELPVVQDEEHVVFDKVRFSYNKTQDNVTDISFKLKQGETLGVIGPTGSGKSTIAQLLMRFYDVDSGAIRIHGKDIRSMTDEQLRTQFGVVFQNDVLFRGDIFENINLGRELTEDQVWTAAKHAQAASFIQEAGGLEAPVSAKGTNFSGGQKQRMLIARALAKKPEILILDDSSSALDYKTDAAMRQVIRQYFDGTTTVIIAQRISSIKHADHILVLEEGQALGYGTHEELMKSCELYQEIARLQMGEGGED
jgi:ATP-binding cassette subfamily B protein